MGDSRTVLHVSEAFGGGVVAAVRSHVAASPEFRHLLAFSDRLEAPLTGHDLDPFDALVTLPHEPLAAIRTIRRAVRKQHVDIVHAHSAIGGALARLAVRSSDIPIVYTPHCFAHLRLDRSGLSRAAYRAVEKRMAANTTVYAACAPYEYEQCERSGPRRPARLRPQCPHRPPTVHRSPGPNDDGRLHILGVGRLFPQKDPEFFAAAVESVRAAGIDLDATWIGDGEAHLRRRLLAADIDVTGWLPREESLRRLAQPGGIYLHSARWEGFPFAILEAHAAGLPLIIRHIPTLAAFAFPHEVRDPSDVPLAVKELAEPHARAEAVAAADDVLGRQQLRAPAQPAARGVPHCAEVGRLGPSMNAVSGGWAVPTWRERTVQLPDGRTHAMLVDTAQTDGTTEMYLKGDGIWVNSYLVSVMFALTQSGARVLDLGGFVGEFALAAAAHGCEVVSGRGQRANKRRCWQPAPN